MMPEMLAHLTSIGLENKSPKLIELENEYREFEMFILKMQKRIASEQNRFVFTDKKFNIDPRGPDGMPTGSAADRQAKKKHIIAEMEQSAYLKELEDTGNKLATLIRRERLGRLRGRRHLIPRIRRAAPASRELLGRRNSIVSVANNERSNNEDEATGIINNNELNERGNAHIVAVAGAGADPGANAGRPRGSSNASTVANGHRSRRPSNAWSNEENENAAVGGASKRRTSKRKHRKNRTHRRKATKRTT